jgi:hypothetical protein
MEGVRIENLRSASVDPDFAGRNDFSRPNPDHVTPRLFDNGMKPPLVRTLGLGRLAYLLWHAPRAVVEKSWREGGPLEQRRDRQGQRAMERAAAELATSRAPAGEQTEIHFLTGRRFWYQTAFCLHSLQARSGFTFRAVIHDDGSLSEPAVQRLQELFPAVEVRRRPDNDARVAALLPPDRFPFLHRERRQSYPNMLKLTDVHAGRQGWRMVLDSDMLFFHRPDFLLEWLRAPACSLYMLDVVESYGYSRGLMETLAGAPIPARVNVGILGLDSGRIDWEQMEFWCRRMVEQERTHYFVEQALSAMLLAQGPSNVAPPADYVVFPDRSDCDAPRATLHHYVAGSKRWYFRRTWRLTPGLPTSLALLP